MIEMSGIRVNSSRVSSFLVLFILVLVLGCSRRVWCANEDEYDESGNSKALPLVTSLIYNQISNLTKIFNKEITETLGYCTKDADRDLDGAFKFSNNLDFLSNCVQETKDVTKRVCTAAEMKFYFTSFMNTKSADAQFLKPNRNCNLTSWVPGCEPGWACTIPQHEQVDLKNSKEIPNRTRDSQPCCAGFFCPRGLTCMIPCPLGSYCPRATLNTTTGICEPYAYQLPPGASNHSCGSADIWAGVTSSDEIFCSAGSYCPTTTQETPCKKGHYCRQGSTEQRACFKLSTCNPNTDTQNLHAYGFLLIGLLTLVLVVFYNCSDQVLTTRYERLAKSRERAAKSARETALARQRWQMAKEATKNRSIGLQQQLSSKFSRKTGDSSSLPPRFPGNSSAPLPGAPKTTKEENNLTKMMQSIEDNPDSHRGFDMAIGDKHIKKQNLKAKQLHTKSQIFKYAYGQLEKEKAMEQKQKLTFSGVISMATDAEMKTRPSLEVAFKDLTITLMNKNKHLMRRVTGKILPGRISAVMGPSGAGKTTFLSAVAGKIRVEENLRFSARCRLSEDIQKADKVLVVERVIESLGLQAVRDSLVGTVERRGISGGQKKRVNVGLEMVMEPSLLILDEPTSGLDSASSSLLIRALRREALEGVNICMVVHQPSYTLYKMFDDLILLAKGGLTVYHGPVKKVEEYFASFGVNVPDRVNPPDHFIDILEGIVKPSGGLTAEQLPVRWMLHNGYPVPPDMLQYCDEIASGSGGVSASKGAPTPEASFAGSELKDKEDHSQHRFFKPDDLSNRRTPGVLKQYRYFLGRNGKQRLREAKLQAADYLILLLAGACLGTLSKVKDDTFGYFGYMYTVIAVSLLCKISALRSFSQDKLEYLRENDSGMSSLAYFLSKDTVDHFNTVIKPVVFLSMFYSFSNPRSTFLENYAVLFCLIYCVTGVAYIFAILLQPAQAQLWCVLLPVVLTLIANQGKDDKFGRIVSGYCYPTWALEAFIIANAQRYSGVWLITRCAALNDFGYDVHNWTKCLLLLILSGILSANALTLPTNMKSAFRSAISTTLAFSFRSLNPTRHRPPLTLLPPYAAVFFSKHSPLTSMAGGESGTHVPSLATFQSLEKQFEEFRHQLEDSGSLRDRIRTVALEIESATRLMYSSLLLIHQSRPVPGAILYHGDWKSETQTVVSLLAFMHWLETGSLLLHTEAEEKLGLNPDEFGLDIEDYLIGVCFMSNDLPRYVVNQVTAGDYDCPRKVLKFLTDLHAAFRMLNLRNDFLRKKFDGMKYDLRRVEEVYYDVKIRGLAANGENTGEQNEQGQS
ncbi:UNVERIFIED_CONTAM: putative white-brown complexprotein 30 [Sesamum calycinum]|uniref:White-brown complexprotein 30 n=1 Tax=Sesamum calycinum TaxID=2727403 RepID=A0AAW2NTF6_9LAMI